MSGNKFDAGKLRVDLIPAEPIEALATILTHGAAKYAPNNWMKGIPFRRVYAAMLRHLLAFRRGKFQDQESGHPHLWHAFCNLAFLIYYNYPDHYARYEKFNDFKQEWAQKLLQKETNSTLTKTCSTCFYDNGYTHERCVECTTKDYSLWEPKDE